MDMAGESKSKGRKAQSEYKIIHGSVPGAAENFQQVTLEDQKQVSSQKPRRCSLWPTEWGSITNGESLPVFSASSGPGLASLFWPHFSGKPSFFHSSRCRGRLPHPTLGPTGRFKPDRSSHRAAHSISILGHPLYVYMLPDHPYFQRPPQLCLRPLCAQLLSGVIDCRICTHLSKPESFGKSDTFFSLDNQ